MKYKQIGTTMPAVEVTFERPGDAVFTQVGGMAWMTDGVTMDSGLKGGLGKSIGRLFAGESLVMTTYTANKANATIAFSSTVPGSIAQLEVDAQHQWVCQKGAFLFAEPSIELSVALTKKFSAGFLGGEGFVLQHLTGQGKVFLEIDGEKAVKQLAPGEVLKVDTGNVVAFESSVQYSVETVPGLKNMFLGGEGAFLTKLTGPGVVLLQTQNFNDFAGRILSMYPKSGH